MTVTASFIPSARQAYVDANAGCMHWLLDRPLLGPGFLNSKQNSITLADYTDADGIRGPGYTYGWIQGRGLEALATHAAYFEPTDPALAEKIDAVARPLYALLQTLWDRHGHAYFCYDAAMRPVIAAADGTTEPQTAPPDVYTYSDIFVLKGLIAASARYDAKSLDRYLAQLPALVAAIESDRFQMDERQALSLKAAASQPKDFGPRMILLGAAGMLTRIGHPEAASFADRFVDFVLEHHLDATTGLLRNVPGGDVSNIGHGIELVGFALDYMPADTDPLLVRKLETILLGSFNIGFQGPGVRLTASVETGEVTSPICPWWSLPETIRSAALCYERTGNPATLEVWRKAHAAFYDHYWRGAPAIAYQTMTADGPLDFVPATPDLDPGYHTGLSLLAAIEAADRTGASSVVKTQAGA